MQDSTPMIEVYGDRSALVARALDLVVAQIQAAVGDRGSCSLALAGGSTPKPLYEALAQTELPLEKLHLFWGDERYVAADHPESNFRMVQEAWLGPAQVPAANVHPMITTATDPRAAAAAYEAELRRVLQPEPGALPILDIVLLGMGDDGHTASLFPQTEALQVCDRWVTVGEKSGQARLTLTVPVINAARTVIFLVSGANKQTALTQVFAQQADSLQYPARLVRPQGKLYWLLDADAGQNWQSGYSGVFPDAIEGAGD